MFGKDLRDAHHRQVVLGRQPSLRNPPSRVVLHDGRVPVCYVCSARGKVSRQVGGGCDGWFGGVELGQQEFCRGDLLLAGRLGDSCPRLRPKPQQEFGSVVQPNKRVRVAHGSEAGNEGGGEFEGVFHG